MTGHRHNQRECWCGIDHELERRIADHGTNAPSAANTWPEGGLPHGENPHDYGYCEPGCPCGDPTLSCPACQEVEALRGS